MNNQKELNVIVADDHTIVRQGISYILKENYAGLGKGFVNFLTHEKGQLIFRRGYLVPDRMALQIRKANVTE